MKIFAVLLLLSVSTSLFAEDTFPEKSLQKWLLSTNVSTDWIFTADQYAFSSSDFQQSYLLFISNLPPEQIAKIPEPQLKKQYLNKFITENLLVLMAFEDGLFQDPDLKAILKMTLVETIYQYYLHSKIPHDKTLFLPTQEEFNRYYETNKDRFDALGMNAAQIKQQAYREISNMKVQQWMFTLVEQSREKHRIERNTNEMRKLGIASDVLK